MSVMELRVELNAVMPASEGPAVRAGMGLTRTLTQTTDVSRVSVSLSGRPWNRPIPTGTYSLDTLVGAGPDGVGVVSGTTMTMLASVMRDLPTASPVDPSLIAWSSADGVAAQQRVSVALIPGAAPRASDDRFGWVWGASTSAASRSRVGRMASSVTSSLRAQAMSAPCVSRRMGRALVIRGADSSAWVGVVEHDRRTPAGRAIPDPGLERGTVIDGSWTTSTGLACRARSWKLRRPAHLPWVVCRRGDVAAHPRER